jgi:hypothetical protein
MILAGAALLATAPAFAQTAREISGDAWSCRLVSLVGDPDSDMQIQYNRDGSLAADFYLELPSGDDLVSVSLSLVGTWTLANDMVNMVATSTQVNGGWINEEELDEDVLNDLAASLEEELSSFAGGSRIAFISRHAMVLEEDETSASCWR